MTTLAINHPMEQIITEFKSKTLRAVQLLRQVNFSEEQADVIVELIEDNAATIEVVLERKIKRHEEEQSKNLNDLATKGDLLIVKKELELQIEKVRSEIEKVRVELRVEIEKVKSDLIKWVAGLMIVNTGLLFTLIKVFA